MRRIHVLNKLLGFVFPDLGRFCELLEPRVHRHQFLPACFAKRLEGINAAMNTCVKFFDRNIWREVLVHDESHDLLRLREHRFRGAEPDAVE